MEIGAGNGTSLPTGIDTFQTYINGPNPRPDSSSRVDAEFANDTLATLFALENDLYRTRVIDARTYSTFTQAVTAAIGKTLLICSSVTLNADTIIDSSTSLLFYKPGVINANSFTLTINGPIVGNTMHQIFSGFVAGDVTFGAKQSIYPQWWGTTTGDVQKAISAAAIGSNINLNGIVYSTYNGLLTIDKALTIDTNGTLTFSTNADNQGIRITASNVTLRNFTINGPTSYTSFAGQTAVLAYGANSSSYINDIIVEYITINNWGFYGINLNFVSDFKVCRNKITNIYLAGIECLSAKYGIISENKIDTITASPNAYGISLSRVEHDSLTVHPRSQDVEVCNNIVLNIPTWHAYDTHGGERINFCNNIAYNMTHGVHVGACDNSSQIETFAPLNCNVTGNILISNTATGSSESGILFVGANGGQKATGTVTGNIVIGFGNQTNAISGGILFRDTQGMTITGNTIIEPAPIGIHIYVNNYDFTCTGNTITDVWTDAVSVAIGIYIRVNSTNNRGYIGGNTFGDDAKVATYLNSEGVRIDNSITNTIALGDNFGSPTTYLYDAGLRSTTGFYAKTGVFQPLANADTSGATLVQLEAEVNELKAILRTLGLMAT